MHGTTKRTYTEFLNLSETEISNLLENTLASMRSANDSKAQLRQDLLVLLATNFKQEGFFVEFGATNGIDLSNTYLLESAYGWNGILAEPATIWHADLQENRSSHIDLSCVWKTSGDNLSFKMVDQPEYSTINAFTDSDHHGGVRENGVSYQVPTICLNDLLLKYDAPRNIDYLSIDTEGSEFEILNAFDFSKHSFSVITVEHNHTPERDRLFELLSEHGYRRQFEAASHWDDWYFRPPS